MFYLLPLLLSIFCIYSGLAAENPSLFLTDIRKHKPFRNIKYGEETGVVKRAFKIKIPDIPFPYNPSLVKKGDGYLLVFRHDPLWDGNNVRDVQIGVIELDRSFKPRTQHSRYLNTGSKSSEDPRLFKMGGKFYTVYTKVTQMSPSIVCHIGLTQFGVRPLQAEESYDLLYKSGNMEKNWTPFVYKNQSGTEEAYLIYKYVPHTVFKLKFPLNGEVMLAHENGVAYELKLWQKKWGEIRGGTPGIKIGSDYITFFHSSFNHAHNRYYVMGALIYEGSPPFRIKKISKEPIIFKGIYGSAVTPANWFFPRNYLRVIFPGGVVKAVEKGRKVFHVVCGENDIAIKCVTIDRQELMKSLIDVTYR